MPSKRHVKEQRHWFLDTWAVEIGAICLSIASFVAMLVLLRHYDGKPQFEWHGVTLNTVVSVLATVARIGLVVPVAESLAQWKWMWFSKDPQPLSNFELLDDASRGSRGSLMLLWETKSWTFTAIGAWIIILSAAIEPFIQQIISFEDTLSYRPDSQVQISYADRWDGGTEIGSEGGIDYTSSDGNDVILHVASYGTVQDIHLDFSAQAAVLFGLSADASHVAKQLPTSCKSGNCTWPSYLSLAVCSACTDVSDKVTKLPKVDFPMEWAFPNTEGREWFEPANLTTFLLPNGVNIDNRNPGSDNLDQSNSVLMTTRSTLRPSESLTFQSHTTLLFSISILRVAQSDLPVLGQWIDLQTVNIHATECGLYFCVKEFESKISNSELLEVSNEITSKRSEASWQVQLEDDQNSIVYIPPVTPAVDALFSNETYFTRTDLMIEVPQEVKSSNGLQSGNVSQAGIDSLSDYVSSLFNDGTFDNVTYPVANDTQCSIGGSVQPCGMVRNITGMVRGTGNLSVETTNGFIGFSPPVMQVLWGSQDLAVTFANLADSITIEMRKHAENSPKLSGELGTVQTLLTVRWSWISLPVLCVCVSLFFLCVSIWEAHIDHTPLWKSSAMAYLCHGLDISIRKTLEHCTLPSQMSREAEELKIQLSADMDGAIILRPVSSEMQPLDPSKMESQSNGDHR